MRRVRALLALVFVGLGASAQISLSAQERIELIIEDHPEFVVEELDVSVSRFGEIRHVTTLQAYPSFPGYPWVALSGARYLVGIAFDGPRRAQALVVFDRRSRAMLGRFALPFYPSGLIADTMRPRIFVYDLSQIGVFDATTLTFRQIDMGLVSEFQQFAYAPKADLIFARDVIPIGGSTSVKLFDVASGRLQRTFLLDELLGAGMIVDATGQRLYTLGRLGRDAASPAGLLLYDAQTGQKMAFAPMLASEFILDEPRHWILVNWFLEGSLAVLDAETLQTLHVKRIDPPPGSEPGLRREFTAIVGRGMTGAYVLRTTQGSPPPPIYTECYAIDIEALDTHGTRRATIDALTPAGLGRVPYCRVVPVLVRSPLPPEALSAVVDGRRASLSWQNPGDVSEFELEVGLTPGARALAQRVGLTTSISFDNVPPGVYYVRVKGINEIGASPPSNEMQVIVR